jgi:histidinol-phosphate aminotransferase
VTPAEARALLERPPFARPEFGAIPLYRSDRPPVAHDLADSTSAWGAPPAALAALAAVSSAAVAAYPSMYGRALDAAIGAYVGVPAECVVTGCGSDDILDCAVRAFGRPGDRLAHPAPTFAMVPLYARANGVVPVAVPLTATFDADADALLASGARIIYLCSPNNPTGPLLARATIERVLARHDGLVILDEAYAEFSGVSWATEAPARGALLVTRTFSKAWGLAGLRVGYGVGAPALVAELARARGPFKTTSVGEAAVSAALAHDAPWMRARVADARAAIARFADRLRADGRAPLPTDANFVCVPCADAPRVVEALWPRGFAVRGFASLPGIGPALRIGAAPWPVLERLADALREVA